MAQFISVQGDLLKAQADALVNTVNCVGVMGRGIALQFKKAFPDNFKAYKLACDAGEVVPGRMFVFDRETMIQPRYIVNFPTKRHWRGKSRLSDIESGLRDLVDVIKVLGLSSIAIPPLGSGLGGLNWTDVRALIETALGEVDGLTVLLHEPGHAPDAKDMAVGRDVPKMTDGRASLVLMAQTYTDGLLEPEASLLEIHKLMYFLQVAGAPLKLRYKAHLRGPYAENLRHVLSHIEGHMITGYGDGGDMPDKPISIVPGALDDAQAHISNQPEAQDRIIRVRDLVEGYETQYALELLASVHWLVAKMNTTDVDHITAGLQDWNPRKARLYGAHQVETAIRTLRDKGWVD